ncbi:MAG TPA: hypothetical protein VGX45_10485 [Solirubrobacteraceae bacterium]|jgi:hypothetical protein|nr:hypothetical protein [Solirubrobacteraceae bacterium]
MPSEVVFAAGASVKVIAGVGEIRQALSDGATTLDTARFAGFRGDAAMAGEEIVVCLAAISYVQAVAAP